MQKPWQPLVPSLFKMLSFFIFFWAFQFSFFGFFFSKY